MSQEIWTYDSKGKGKLVIDVEKMKDSIQYSRRPHTRSIAKVHEQEKETVHPVIFYEQNKYEKLLE